MKKTTYYIIGFGLAVLCFLLSGCIDSNSIEPPVVVPEGEGFLSINLSTGQIAATKGPIEEIDPWEHRVNEVWILLYNESNALEYKFELKIRNYADTNPLKLEKFTNTDEEVIREDNAGTTKFQSIAQSVKRQQYRMAVLANPPAGVFEDLDFSKGASLSNLTDAIDNLGSLAIEQFGGYEGNESAPLFFMSNANGLITVPTSKLFPTQAEAHSQPVQIHIDRLLAKVSVKEREDGIGIFPQSVRLDAKRPLRWYTDVTNTSTYLIRQFAPLSGGTVMETEENSPKDRETVYARDPNFALTENAASAFYTWSKNESKPYATWISTKSPAEKALRTYQYVMENTFDKETQQNASWSNYATKIVLKVHLIYTYLLWDMADLENEDDPNRNYYSCLLNDGEGETEWRVFSQDQVAHWLDRGFPYVEEKDEENEIETANRLRENKWTNLLKAKIEKIQSEYGKVEGAFNFATTEHPGTAETLYSTYDGVTYHPMGLNYYVIPIRHFGDSEGATDPRAVYGYYGVVRNNMYTVTLNTITGPGDGYYNWDSRFISADISITPWYRRKQGVELEY